MVTIPFTDNPIVAPAGGSTTFKVQAHVASTGTAGTIGFKVTGMNGTPSGLPVMGNLNTLAATDNTLGTLTVDQNNLSITNAVSVDIGRTDYVLAKFRLVAGANEDVTVSRISLFQNGTAADADLVNWDLVDPNGTVLATVATASNKVINFVLATPYTLAKGVTRDLSVRVDVVSGSSRTGQVVIQNNYDLQVKGVSTGLGILPTASLSVDTAGFPIGNQGTNPNTLTIAQGNLTLNKSGSSPSGTFGIGQSNITLAVWELQASGEDIQIQRAAIEIGGTADTITDGVATADHGYSGTVKLMTDAGQVLYSVAATTAALYDGDDDQVTFASYYTIPAGTILKLKLVVDASTAVDNGETSIGSLGTIYFYRMTSNTYATTSQDTFAERVSGNTLTASTATLTVVNNAALGAATVIEGQSELLIGSFLLQTSASEGVNVSSIVIDIAAGDVAVATGLSNAKIKRADTGAQLGSIISAPAATDNTFTVSGELNIPASTTVQIDLYANASTAAADGGDNDTYTASMNANDVTGVGATSGTTISGPAATVTARALLVVQGGTATVAIDSTGAASSAFLTPGLTGVEMGRVKMSATVEDMKVQSLTLRTVNGAGNISSVKLLGTGLSSDPSTSLTAGTAVFTFASGSEIVIPAYGSRVLTAVASTTPAGTLIGGDFGVLGFGTADLIGAGSGLVTQERLTGTVETVTASSTTAATAGDVIYFTATAAAGTNTTPGFYMVTTVNNTTHTTAGALDLNSGATGTSFAVGDIVTTLTKVATDLTIDNMSYALAVGDLVYVHDASTPANDGFKIVRTAVASGATAVGANTVDDITLQNGGTNIDTDMDVITKFTNSNGLAGNTMRLEEVEPVLALTATGGTSSPAADQTVGTLAITASGYRDMTFNGIVFEKLGSSADWNVKDFKLYNGDNLISEVSGLAANTRTTATAQSPGAQVTVASTRGFLIGDPVLYIERDTEANSNVSTVSSVDSTTTMTLAADIVGTSETEDYFIVYTVSDQDTSVAVSGTSVTFDVADASKYQVGDQVYTRNATVAADGGGGTVASVGANSITVTQAALTGIADNADASSATNSVTVYNITRGSGTVVFDANSPVTALAVQTVTAGQTMTLTVKADTTYVKRAEDSSGNVTSVAATFGIRIPGAKGPLQVTSAQVEGFSWAYSELNTAGSTNGAYQTEGDSYGSAVTGATFSY
jgi:hypothetical protein